MPEPLPAGPAGPPAGPLPLSSAAALRPATYRDIISAEAKKARVPPELAFAMVDQESGGDPTATSQKGAHGFFQLMPETAKALGVDPSDPIQNIRGGLTYMRQMLDRHKGDVRLALASYNAGPGAVAKAGGVPDFPETTAYVQKILGRLQGAQPTTPAGKPALGRPQVGQPPTTATLTPEEAAGTPSYPTVKPLTHPAPPDIQGPIGAEPAYWLERGARAAGEAFDPRTPEGRRNLAGGAGAALATAATVSTGGLAAVAIPVLGATGGGMIAESGEQLVGTKPPSGLETAKAGGEMGLYELVGGQLLPYAAKAIGRRMIASSVGKAAAEHLATARTSVITRFQNAVDAASATAGQIKTLAGQTVRNVRQSAAQSIKGARTAGEQGVKSAEAQAEAATTAAAAPYSAMVAQPPSAATAGRAAQATISGPATTARDLVGQQVEAAAQSGPRVDITALKAEAQTILERIAKPQRTFPHGMPEAIELPPGFPSAEMIPQLEAQAAGAGADAAQARSILAARESMLADLTAAQDAAHTETLKHPALGVIQRILNADDTVPFHDLHLWKSELQNSLQGSYDKAVNKQVTSITQKLAGGMREALAVHQPYNEATAAYAEIVPLYTKEYAAKLRRAASTDPESLIRMITPQKPTAARMLRDLLVEQSAQGGKPGQGQAAWDLVRSAWTHKNVLKGGIENLDANLAKLPKEFSDIFYGDAKGQQVVQNLRQIASAYKAAKGAGEAGVEAAKASGKSGVERAAAAGRSQVEAATQGREAVRLQAAQDVRTARRDLQVARRPTLEETRFQESSIAGRQPTPGELAAHGVRAVVLGPTQIWGGLSWIKLLSGPKERDLIEWAAYSPANTQRLVRLMTGPSPTGLALADLFRASGILDAAKPTSEKPSSRVGQPPPR